VGWGGFGVFWGGCLRGRGSSGEKRKPTRLIPKRAGGGEGNLSRTEKGLGGSRSGLSKVQRVVSPEKRAQAGKPLAWWATEREKEGPSRRFRPGKTGRRLKERRSHRKILASVWKKPQTGIPTTKPSTESRGENKNTRLGQEAKKKEYKKERCV